MKETLIRLRVILNEDRMPKSAIIKRFDIENGEVDQKMALNGNGEWVLVPEGAGYPDECMIPVSAGVSLEGRCFRCGKMIIQAMAEVIEHGLCDDCWMIEAVKRAEEQEK